MWGEGRRERVPELSLRALAGSVGAKMPVLDVTTKTGPVAGTGGLDPVPQECKRPWGRLRGEPKGFKLRGPGRSQTHLQAGFHLSCAVGPQASPWPPRASGYISVKWAGQPPPGGCHRLAGPGAGRRCECVEEAGGVAWLLPWLVFLTSPLSCVWPGSSRVGG